MDSSFHFKFRVKRRTVVGGADLQRRAANAAPFLAIIAVLASAGAIAAGMSRQHNAMRAARYASDPSCRTSLFQNSSNSPKGLCSSESATVAARWVHSYRGSHYYRLALRASDGIVDSIEAKGRNDKAIWIAAPVGAAVTVRRFTENGLTKRHVTLVAAGGLDAQTQWNPAWEANDAELGGWFLAIVALLSTAGLVWTRARHVRTTASPR